MIDQTSSYYTVQPGDTLHSLALFCYRDINKWTAIQQENPTLQGYEPDALLSAGDQLTLPFIPELTTTILTEEGDTLGVLAQFYYQSADKWTVIQQENPTLQNSGQNDPLPQGVQLTLPFIPERTIILVTNEGDTLRALAHLYYGDDTQAAKIRTENPMLPGYEPDDVLPTGLQLTLPFIPELTTTILSEEGDTLGVLAEFYYHKADQWVRIRQINTTFQSFSADSPIPVGVQLTLPSFTDVMATRVIVTEGGDTLRALTQTYYHHAEQWIRTRQINPTLHGFSADQPLPVGIQLLVPISTGFQLFRLILTGNGATLITLARDNYGAQHLDKWTVIRQANPRFHQYSSNQLLPVGVAVTIP